MQIHTQIHIHNYHSKISTECKWLKCMTRTVTDSTKFLNGYMFKVNAASPTLMCDMYTLELRVEPILHAGT